MRSILVLIGLLFIGTSSHAQFNRWKKIDNHHWRLDSVAEFGGLGLTKRLERKKDTVYLRFFNERYIQLNLDRFDVLTEYKLVKSGKPYIIMKAGFPITMQVVDYSKDHLHLLLDVGDYPGQGAHLYFKRWDKNDVNLDDLVIGQYREYRERTRSRWSPVPKEQAEFRLLADKTAIVKVGEKADTGSWKMDPKTLEIALSLNSETHKVQLYYVNRNKIALEGDLFENGYINLKEDASYFRRLLRKKKREELEARRKQLRQLSNDERATYQRQNPEIERDVVEAQEMEIVEEEPEIAMEELQEVPEVAPPPAPRAREKRTSLLDEKITWVIKADLDNRQYAGKWSFQFNSDKSLIIKDLSSNKIYKGTWEKTANYANLIITLEGKEQVVFYRNSGRSYRDQSDCQLYLQLPGEKSVRKLLLKPAP